MATQKSSNWLTIVTTHHYWAWPDAMYTRLTNKRVTNRPILGCRGFQQGRWFGLLSWYATLSRHISGGSLSGTPQPTPSPTQCRASHLPRVTYIHSEISNHWPRWRSPLSSHQIHEFSRINHGVKEKKKRVPKSLVFCGSNDVCGKLFLLIPWATTGRCIYISPQGEKNLQRDVCRVSCQVWQEDQLTDP